MTRCFCGSFVLAGLLGACGGGGGRSPSGGACLPVAPMRLLALEHGREWEPMALLAADGTITTTFNKRRAPVLRIQGDRLVSDSGPAVTCGGDGVVRMDGSGMTMRFDAQGALTDGGGMRIYVTDAGVVEATLGGGGRSREPAWRIEGVTPTTRRTAEMLVFASIASIDWHFH